MRNNCDAWSRVNFKMVAKLPIIPKNSQNVSKTNALVIGNRIANKLPMPLPRADWQAPRYWHYWQCSNDCQSCQ